MKRAFLAILKRDIRLALKQAAGTGIALGFLLLVLLLIPLAIGPNLPLLEKLAVGFLWIALLLASLLTLDQVFTPDYEDGSLDLMMMTAVPLEVTVVAKSLAHWLTTTLPLALASPLCGMFLNIRVETIFPLLCSMLVGTLGLSFVGAVGSALTLALRRGGLLTAVLVLPLYVPLLIFAVPAGDLALSGNASFSFSFTILIALTCAVMAFSPFAAAAALRSCLR